MSQTSARPRGHARGAADGVGRLDMPGSRDHSSGMTESPYAIPVEELMRTTRVPVTELVVEQPLQVAPPPDWSCSVPLGDGGCDADGE